MKKIRLIKSPEIGDYLKNALARSGTYESDNHNHSQNQRLQVNQAINAQARLIAYLR